VPSRKRGHFEVQVDGRKVAERKGGLVAKLVKRPWPDPEDVVAAVRAATQPAAD
jgi:hypothetical protein